MKQVIKAFLKKVVPDRWHSGLRRFWNRIKYFGISRRCPVCGSFLRRFFPHISREEIRPDADCPVCYIQERHRFIWLFFKKKTNILSDSLEMLHIAPEKELSMRLASIPNLKYVTGDLYNPAAEIKMDISHMPFPDGFFDVIFCSHVLNVLSSDAAAMQELYRVIKPGGVVYLQVPVNHGASTVECPSNSSVEERVRAFGDPAIYRIYGKDLVNRLKNAMFGIKILKPSEILSPRKMLRYGIKDEALYICRRG